MTILYITGTMMPRDCVRQWLAVHDCSRAMQNMVIVNSDHLRGSFLRGRFEHEVCSLVVHESPMQMNYIVIPRNSLSEALVRLPDITSVNIAFCDMQPENLLRLLKPIDFSTVTHLEIVSCSSDIARGMSMVLERFIRLETCTIDVDDQPADEICLTLLESPLLKFAYIKCGSFSFCLIQDAIQHRVSSTELDFRIYGSVPAASEDLPKQKTSFQYSHERGKLNKSITIRNIACDESILDHVIKSHSMNLLKLHIYGIPVRESLIKEWEKKHSFSFNVNCIIEDVEPPLQVAKTKTAKNAAALRRIEECFKKVSNSSNK